MVDVFHPMRSEDAVEFFKKKINAKIMKLAKLPIIGYNFLEEQFKKLNKKNILEHPKLKYKK